MNDCFRAGILLPVGSQLAAHGYPL